MIFTMNAKDYHKKIQDILNDNNKFRILKKDSTEKLKVTVNRLIQNLHIAIEVSKPIISCCSIFHQEKIVYQIKQLFTLNFPDHISYDMLVQYFHRKVTPHVQ